MTHSVGRLTAISLGASVLDRVFGVVLLAVIAAVYGASSESDTYFLALVVPTALGGALTEALYVALLPLFSAAAGARVSLGRALRLSAAIGGGLTGLYGVAVLAWRPSQIAAWLVPTPVVPAMACAGACAAALVARGKYVAAASRLPLGTAFALLVIAVVVPFEDAPVVFAGAIALGYLGALGVLLVAAARSRAPAPAAVGGVSSAGVTRATASVFLAALVGGPLVVVVERGVAAGLAAGSIALLTFARNLALLPLMISQALANGMFPVATVRSELADRAPLLRLVLGTFRAALLVSLSASAYIVLCRHDLVQLALKRGALTSADAGAVAELVATLAGAAVGLSLAAVTGRAFFALGRYRLVTALSALSLASYVVLAVALADAYGRQGLAAAFLASSLAGGAVSVVVLLRALDVPLRRFVVDTVVTPLALACVFAAGVYAGLRLAPDGELTFGLSLARLTVAGLTGLVALGGAVLLLRTPEYGIAVGFLRRLRRL